MPFSDLHARIASAIRATSPITSLSSRDSSPSIVATIDFADRLSNHLNDRCGVYEFKEEHLGTWSRDLNVRVRRMRNSLNTDSFQDGEDEWCNVLSSYATRILIVDCESLGTASILPIFLIGTIWLEGDSISASQWLARDYSEERAMLSSFASSIREMDVMFTYNGRTFDVPYMKSRCCFHRIEFPSITHVDVLPLARKRWRDRLPNLQLRTIETFMCGRDRIDDLPSSQVPMHYHAHVQDPATNSIAPVLRHNLLDMMTLLETICLLIELRV